MSDPDPDLEPLLDYLKLSRGFDFTGYKRPSLARRIDKRMGEVGIGGYQEYLDYLEVHPDEFAALFNTILINVTAFFRDADTWDHLRRTVVPRLLERVGDAPVRVWCAGCASGEETYTTAMVLAEALGERTYLQRVKIYATDIDEDALQEARLASYSAKQLEAVPEDLRERFFEPAGERFTVANDLRRTVIFGRNDLVQDAPISRVDLLLCRNTLMYFNAETQSAVIDRFHFALADHGCLVLGKSEMLIRHTGLFTPIDLKHRVFSREPRARPRERRMFPLLPADGDGRDSAVRERAFDTTPVAQVAIDAHGGLLLANERARTLFHLTEHDLGRPFKDLELSYKPAELRSSLDEAYQERTSRTLSAVEHADGDGITRALQIEVAPLLDAGDVLGATITFADVTERRRLQEELEASRSELGEAYEELQSTVEELETTNEELQSTNEELETTNEELQATNEELETMNEELQSTNEELEAMNGMLRSRTSEINEANAFLETILTSIGMAVAVVDGAGTIRVWNDHAEELWGLRAAEVQGESLLGLDIGLPVASLQIPLQRVLAGESSEPTTILAAVNRRGRALECKVSVLPLRIADGDVTGAVLLMESEAR